MKEKITILGAGISGLAIGWRFLDNPINKNFSITILEKSKNIGGICSTFKYKNYKLDYGPHKFYSQIKGLMPLYKNLLNEDCLTVKKTNSLRLLGKYFSFPPKPAQLISGIGIFRGTKIVASFGVSFIKSLLSRKKPKTYEDYFINGFGEQGYNIIFKDLAHKMWGDPKTLSEELARRRIPIPNVFSFISNTLSGAKNKPDVSAEYFYYPKYGFGMICEKLEEKLKKAECKIMLNSFPVKINIKNNKANLVMYKKGKKLSTIKTDYLISTIPLLDLIETFSPKPPKEVIEAARNLQYRNLTILYIFSNKDRIIKDNWYFYPGKEFIFNRVAELNSFSPHTIPKGKSCITVEVSSEEGDPFFKLNNNLVFEKITEDLKKAEVIKKEEITDYTIKRIEKVYPIYDLNFRKNLNIITEYLLKIENIFSIGRYGLFNYNNADHCIDMSIKSADFIIGGKSKDELRNLIAYFDNYKIVD